MLENSAHKDQVLRLLGQYQLLEFSLKLYISTAYSIVKHALNETIPFDYGYQYIDKFSLGKLVREFARLNENAVLMSKLKSIESHRNHVAHRAMVEQHEIIRDVLNLNTKRNIVDLHLAEMEIDECLIQIAAELEQIIRKLDDYEKKVEVTK